MEKKVTVLITFSIAVMLVIGLYVFTDWFSKVTGYIFGEAQTDKLVTCLATKNTELYVAEYCESCEQQQKLFGSSKKKLSIVSCGKNGEACTNIRELPAWYVNGSIHYGLQNLSQIDELSGCSVISDAAH